MHINRFLKYYSFFLFTLFTHSIFSQTSKIDSLKNVIELTLDTKLKSELLIDLVTSNMNPSIKILLKEKKYNEHLNIAKQLLNQKYVQEDLLKNYRVHNYIIDNFYNQRKSDSIIKYVFRAQKIIPEPSEAIFIYDRLAEMFYIKADYITATKYADSSLSLCNKFDKLKYKARALYRLAKIQRKTKFYDEALVNFQSSLDILLEKDSLTLSIGGTYLEMGRLSKQVKKYHTALGYLQKAYNVYEKLNRKRSLARIHDEFTVCYIKLKDYENSFYHVNQAIKIKNEINVKSDLKHSYSRLGRLYYLIKNKDFKKAIYYLNLSKKLYQKGGTIEQKMYLELYLYNAHKLKKDLNQALNHYEQYVIYKDSLNQSINKKLIAEAEVKYKTLEKEKDLVIEREKTQIQKNKKQKYFILALTTSLLAASFLLIIGLIQRKKRQQKLSLQSSILEVQRYKQQLFNREKEVLQIKKQLNTKLVLYDEDDFRIHLKKKFDLVKHPHLLEIWESILLGYSRKEYAKLTKTSENTIKTWRNELYNRIKKVTNSTLKRFSDKQAVIEYNKELRFFENQAQRNIKNAQSEK